MQVVNKTKSYLRACCHNIKTRQQGKTRRTNGVHTSKNNSGVLRTGTGRQEGVGVIAFFFKGGWTDDSIRSTLGRAQVGVRKNKTLNCL